MLILATNLSLGRQEAVYASSNAVSMLQGQVSYAPLLEQAGVIWLDEWQKSLDQQLDLCAKADEVFAEACELSDQGKFQEAQWALDAIYRQFDFSQPLEPDSTGMLMSRVNSLAQGKRYELKAALKEVEDLAQILQLIESSADPEKTSQIPAAEMADQVTRILRSGPALVSLKMTPDEAQTSPPGGDTA
jgi:hypothetical protein